jgi:predicted nucleic acid-binding protein
VGRVSDLAGRRLYLDTNLFVYALEDITPWSEVAQAVFRLCADGAATAVVSELALAECLVKPLRDGNDEVVRVYLLGIHQRPGLAVAPVSKPVLLEAARLRAAHAGLKTPDAIHAATAALSGCDILVTNDVRLRIGGGGVEVQLLSEVTP